MDNGVTKLEDTKTHACMHTCMHKLLMHAYTQIQVSMLHIRANAHVRTVLYGHCFLMKLSLSLSLYLSLLIPRRCSLQVLVLFKCSVVTICSACQSL